MLPKRLKISKSASDTLRVLKGRTGLTPNLVCRMALLLSLEEGAGGGSRRIDEFGSEFNAPTLFGEFGFVFEGLLRQVHGRLDAKDVPLIVASHIDSGLERLRKSRSLLELTQHSGLLAA
ncbi:DNA sulfur modification protein DndE [Ramlibacter rhizophilus]|uniref:DNA sulfur modification protein DndE n=1 Tax=Ramlibacter rhizophilus TaxID=1781167 RepID=A0A4Z0BZJ3_9BURK|nr:DNA sulfur modification protein DndE [Ramlibacter rhizophilus]TFZ03379.1 DNA sulfur modification protein DndE [Ramlibacter rhizophilus]